MGLNKEELAKIIFLCFSCTIETLFIIHQSSASRAVAHGLIIFIKIMLILFVFLMK